MDTKPPTLDEIEALAIAARDALPEPYRTTARKVSLRIDDLASDSMLAWLGVDNPYELTGLYDGVPMTEKSVMDQPMSPDTIWLYRLAILAEWCDRGNVTLGQLVAHVLVHELAHHYGWSDEDIAEIDPWWE